MNDAEIQAELEAVARDLNVQRATLRLPSDESVFPIAYEHCEPGTHSIRDTPRLDMSKQPVVLKMQAGASQVVEDDCNVSTDDPGYPEMRRPRSSPPTAMPTARSSVCCRCTT